ncbi:hypothetical protein [Nocardioides humi]|uniref:Uncharacterized protein n=1 Tax=Nocardioides humi TaxID=449461 RepID=A0ABN2BNK6_9ACTN|nr:hypothetical protein [Nocardioides humi]
MTTSTSTSSTETIGSVLDRYEHGTRRALQEALAAGLRSTWLRRAEEFERARPRPGDYVGRSTPEERAARDRRLARMAEMCRHRASLASPVEFEDLVWQVVT